MLKHMSDAIVCPSVFIALTGNSRFKRRRLFEEHFAKGEIPTALNLPTGLGVK